ncbi:hypothetical protein TNCV_2189551 [Trichonephila clavipes]|nr:hypothetical protein TNCV_2189551 [Trichonephila clavipes]
MECLKKQAELRIFQEVAGLVNTCWAQCVVPNVVSHEGFRKVYVYNEEEVVRTGASQSAQTSVFTNFTIRDPSSMAREIRSRLPPEAGGSVSTQTIRNRLIACSTVTCTGTSNRGAVDR